MSIDALTTLDQLEALVCNPSLVGIAESLPVHDHADGGRPRHYSAYAMVLVHCAAKGTFGGRVRRTFTELSDPRIWAILREQVHEAHPHRPDLWLPAEPMRRHHYLAFRDRYLASDEGLAGLGDGVRQQACTQAKPMGLLQEAPSFTHPSLTSCIEGDGKVITAITRYKAGDTFVDPETGEIKRRRHDPDVQAFTEGTGERVTGHRFVILSTRGEGWMNRLILGVASSPKGSEIDALMPMVEMVNEELRVGALLYDGALRGARIDEILRRFGIVCVSPVIAKSNGRGRNREERIVTLPEALGRDGLGNRVSLLLVAVGGMPCEVEFNETGDRVFRPLVLKRLARRGRPGKFRLYGEYEAEGGVSVVLRLYQNAEDRTRKFNRAEHLRPFPPGSDDYRRLYGRRADTESFHRQLEDACWQKRANCLGRNRVHADVLGFALAHNAFALFVHRRNSLAPPTDLAA